jgi:hypothetical protein
MDILTILQLVTGGSIVSLKEMELFLERLCSNTDTIADFEPFLYDILLQIFILIFSKT